MLGRQTEEQGMPKGIPEVMPKDPYRRVNALLAAVITLFFLIHGALGCLLLLFPGFPHEWAVIVWIGAALVGLHVVLSVITTLRMLTDTERPPSQRKKRHQVLKWVTGIVLLVCVILHLVLFRGQEPPIDSLQANLVAAILMILLVVSLGVHICTGIKSLTRDLDLPKAIRTPLRLATVLLALCLGAALLIAAFF